MQAKRFRIHLRFERLGLSLSDGTRIIHGISGELRPGRMCAVMGVSGSGKTSFISALAGRATYGTTHGTLFVNKRESKLTKFSKMVGFVPQEDTMFRELTVKGTPISRAFGTFATLDFRSSHTTPV
jgi:ABC-type multidrug transport system ATPase subunit